MKWTLEGKSIEGPTPLDITKQIHDHSDKALDLLEDLDAGGDKELAKTLTDIETIAYLGKYYGHKIHGATELQMYRKSQKSEHQQAAVKELE